MKRVKKGWTPSLWASLKPFGIGEPHPNNYLEIWKAFWDNRDQFLYTWRILRHGVCDGCSLGTDGKKDWTLAGVHHNAVVRLEKLQEAVSRVREHDGPATT